MPTGSSSVIVRCIFCDQDGPRAREDVISTWIAEELGGTAPFFTDHFAVTPEQPVERSTQRTGSLASLKLPDICETCNRGWMSRLEDLTRPLLLEMIHGNPAVLSPAIQRQIAAWAHLKGITLDAYYAIRYNTERHLPPSVAHTFYGSVQPLPGCSVMLGKFEAFEVGVGIPFGRRMFQGNQPQLGGMEMKGVRVTFAYKYLLVQPMIAWLEAANLPLHMPPHTNGERFIKIWQPGGSGDLVWPPPQMIRRDDFESVA